MRTISIKSLLAGILLVFLFMTLFPLYNHVNGDEADLPVWLFVFITVVIGTYISIKHNMAVDKWERENKPKIKTKKYYLATIKRGGDFPTKMIALDSSIAHFLSVEMDIGRDTHVMYSCEITKEEYDEWLQEKKKMKEFKGV